MWVGLSGAPGGLRHRCGRLVASHLEAGPPMHMMSFQVVSLGMILTMPLPGTNAQGLDMTMALPLYLMTSSNHEGEVLSPSSR